MCFWLHIERKKGFLKGDGDFFLAAVAHIIVAITA
jgi:hypothetical protein